MTVCVPMVGTDYYHLVTSHWLAVLVGTVGAVFGIRRPYEIRFSLRTLLIAMTAIAVVLGLVVWAVR
jgi:hypothetical protein